MRWFLLVFLLIASPVSAGTYYVSKSGSDLNSCAAAQSLTLSSQKFTISAGAACLQAGDTLYIHAGTYTGLVNSINSDATVVNGGTNFGSGAITISAFPTETVIIQPGSGGGNCITLTTPAQKYIIFNRLILDGTGMADFSGGIYVGVGVSHIRFQNGEIRNQSSGVNTSANFVGDLQLLSNNIHHNGGLTSPQTHNIYLTSSNNLIRDNDIHHSGGFGITIYDATSEPGGNLIERNAFHDNALNYGAEIGIAGGDANIVRNNMIYGNGPGYALFIAYATPTNTQIYNNTFLLNGALYIDSDAQGTLLKNNIIRSSDNAGPGTIQNFGSGTVQTTNLTSDPTFANVGSNDYHILTSSAAKDTGTTLVSVTDDYFGIARPQNGTYDIGAAEFNAGTPPPPDPPFVPGAGNLRILRHR